jgi:hypothetical protein
MKYVPTIAAIVAQQGGMIFFMRVARWDIFLSAGLSALIAIIIGFAIHFTMRRIAARKNSA